MSERPLLSGDVELRLRELLEARAPVYAEAHLQLQVAGVDQAVEQAARSLERLARERVLVMPLGLRTYRVHFAAVKTLVGHLDALKPSSTVVLTEKPVRALTRPLSALKPVVQHCLPGRGDRDKSLTTVRALWDAALAARIDRDAVVVGVGGGVVTDLAGFVAATLLRGVRYASAPTTLLSMVDASVGGKTGFDHPEGKNLIGAFHHPSVVVCDVAALETLPPRHLKAGLAEVVKIALVRDAELLAQLHASSEALAKNDVAALADLLPRTIQAKIDVVAQDEREGGLRALLNFGHTVGHAIEQAASYRLPHGECVAIGLRAALSLGARLGVTSSDTLSRSLELLEALGLPATAPAKLDRTAALRALKSDKKRKGGKLRFVLCDGLGSGVLRSVDPADVVWALDAVLARKRG